MPVLLIHCSGTLTLWEHSPQNISCKIIQADHHIPSSQSVVKQVTYFWCLMPAELFSALCFFTFPLAVTRHIIPSQSPWAFSLEKLHRCTKEALFLQGFSLKSLLCASLSTTDNRIKSMHLGLKINNYW